ncbi:MAG TPA: DoxX family protein [Cytophagaceae bacterium]|jgi:hypothetical protein|nr:DoxX family protein [Cytophagaceae bacterium]
MKKINIFYWICTGILLLILGIGSIFDLMGNAHAIQAITALGYPAYLLPFLGVARLLGLVVILMPQFSRLKEWAYAGLAYDTVGAMYSQLAVGSPLTHLLFPLVCIVCVFVSYFLGHVRLKQTIT